MFRSIKYTTSVISVNTILQITAFAALFKNNGDTNVSIIDFVLKPGDSLSLSTPYNSEINQEFNIVFTEPATIKSLVIMQETT